MGCDIHSYAEVRRDGNWEWVRTPFPNAEFEDDREEVWPNRDYGLFGFLADVRNYSHSPVIAEPRGLPEDVSADLRHEHDEWGGDAHSASWLTLAGLAAYDYDQAIWDRRVTRETSPGSFNGRALAEEGEGEHLPLREFLGGFFFDRLEDLRELGDPEDVRVVFWFDN